MSVDPKGPREGGEETRRGGIDPAALAAATLAPAISTIAQPGPYGPTSIILGVAVLLLIFGYDIDPYRSTRQSLAFASVVALNAVLALGYPMECIFSPYPLDRLHDLLHDPKTAQNFSEVPPLVAIAVWGGLTAIVWFYDTKLRWRKRK